MTACQISTPGSQGKTDEFKAFYNSWSGWWDELTPDEKKEAEGRNWKTDLSGGIQRVVIKHGCAPFGSTRRSSGASAHRTRTQKRATARLLEWLAEYAPYEKLAVLHAGVQEEAEALYQQTRNYFPQGDVLIAQITPVLGAHLGIGALGFACISKE